MNTPGIEFGRKTSAAYAALCKPLCQKLHLPQTAFDILMFLANNPGYQTASDVVEVRKLKANLVSVNVDRLVQEGYLVREADPAAAPCCAAPKKPAPSLSRAGPCRRNLAHVCWSTPMKHSERRSSRRWTL
mgnify:CR=1 FL=1